MFKGGKKLLIIISTIIMILGLIISVVVMNHQFTKYFETINGRILYLQDSISILQTDLNNMKEEIRITLEEENSLLEQHSFEIVDMDFAKNTYSLEMTIIPKDYTDTTEVSVFFGTTQFDLEARDFFFTGIAELPFDDSFAGNVTVLLKDGNSKNTEVLKGYDGFVNDFAAMVKATAMTTPSLKDGVLSANGPARIEVDGKNRFDFLRCNLWIEVNGERVYGRDYLKYSEEETGNSTISAYLEEGDGLELVEHTAVASFIGADGSSIKTKVSMNDKIRIYIEAETEDHFIFQYDVFNGTVNETGDGFQEDSLSFDSNALMIDHYSNIKYFTK